MTKVIQTKRILREARTMLKAHKNYPKVRKQTRGTLSPRDLNTFVAGSDRKFAQAEKYEKKAEKLREGVERSAGKIQAQIRKSKNILRAHLKREQPKVWRDFEGRE